MECVLSWQNIVQSTAYVKNIFGGIIVKRITYTCKTVEYISKALHCRYNTNS